MPSYSPGSYNPVVGFAPINSPAFTGAPTAPTPAPGDDSTKIATTAFVDTALAGYVPTGAISFAGNQTGPYLQVANGSNEASLHLVDGAGFTGPYLLGIGITEANTKGQVIDVNGSGQQGLAINLFNTVSGSTVGLAGQLEAGAAGTLLQLNSDGGGGGTILSLHAQGVPAAGQVMEQWLNDGQVGSFHGAPIFTLYADTAVADFTGPSVRMNGVPLSITAAVNNSAGSASANALDVHQMTLESDATHGPQASFNWYSGTPGQYFSHRWIPGNTTELQLQCATGAAAIGSETWDTLLRATAFTGTPKLAFFNAPPAAQFAAITAPAGGTTVDSQARTAIQSILNVLSAAAGGFGLTA